MAAEINGLNSTHFYSGASLWHSAGSGASLRLHRNNPIVSDDHVSINPSAKTTYIRVSKRVMIMQVTYELNPNELTPVLLESLRALFPNRRVRITVQETSAEEVVSEDETTYLLSSPANSDALAAGLADVAEGRVFHVSSIAELEQMLSGHA